ncbi:MAG: hypothetical protein HY457_00020 [Parcubacteria group bacterium]|nr:hypothetical protein [Parcubacteria group bacterium]
MIQDVLEKCKIALRKIDRREDWFIIALIILVGFGGFGLGRLSLGEGAKEPVLIENLTTQGREGAQKGIDTVGAVGQVVASRNGGKYHFPWCSSAERISQENRVWFESVEQAKRAGYTPASNCPGLE